MFYLNVQVDIVDVRLSLRDETDVSHSTCMYAAFHKAVRQLLK